MSWDCPNERSGLCNRVGGACCQPGMKGCILAGKVGFPDRVIPSPVWPPMTPAPKEPSPKPPAPEEGNP